eukprot:gnl/TRDRNA2_/TRDRNA2_160471_c0_seq1.p1 gnl/TRDRNA2_/TRDRNA2_160471_c0~~gnl/TRDRNA2_/TRDRNA2_160471_c0_seq1.p1  ORF type:complete len:382 (+),score=53.78 gnl/TRDRNA2_/TRDRNA2_160471_c0_seq1:46-1146(+)
MARAISRRVKKGPGCCVSLLLVRLCVAAERLPEWATHAGCAEIVRNWDFSENYSDVTYMQFQACLVHRTELPGFRSKERPALLSGEHFPVAITPSKISPPGYWVLPPWDYVVSNFIRRDGTYEPLELELFQQMTRTGDVVCDVGAHVGGYTVPLAAHVGQKGAVHSFEPFRLVFQLLMANVAVNGLANVYGHNLALGEREELRSVLSPSLTRWSNIGATSVDNQVAGHFTKEHVLQYEGEETVRVAALDSLGLARVDFIKVDVEGMLDPVLKGAKRTVARHRPLMTVEHTGNKAPPMLIEWGYRCVKVLPRHEVWACVPQEKWGSTHWLARTIGEATRGTQDDPSVQRRRDSPTLESKPLRLLDGL